MQDKLGRKLIIGEEAHRDAVHVAVMPLTAHSAITRGASFALNKRGEAIPCPHDSEQRIGVVDPYIPQQTVESGDRFWGFLWPNTVIGMRHCWEHPSIEPETPMPGLNDRQKSQIWLEFWCERWNVSLEQTIKRARLGEMYVGSDLGYDEDWTDFWHHIGVYLGEPFSERHQEQATWRCGC